jgi:hypothetical protein
MKLIAIRPIVAGLLQAAGLLIVELVLYVSSERLFRFIEDPFSAMLIVSTFLMACLLAVIAYPAYLVGSGKKKQALEVFGWNFLWLLVIAVLWMFVLAPHLTNYRGLYID